MGRRQHLSTNLQPERYMHARWVPRLRRQSNNSEAHPSRRELRPQRQHTARDQVSEFSTLCQLNNMSSTQQLVIPWTSYTSQVDSIKLRLTAL